MRVALFTDTFLPQINGVTNTLVKMLEYFNKHGIDYIVFAPEHGVANLNDIEKIERFFSIKFFLYPECRISFPNLFRIKKTLLDYKPDVIHLMTEFSMGLSGLYYGKKYHIPTLSNYTTHFPQYLQYYNLKVFEKNAWDYMNWFHNQNEYTLCASTDTKALLNSEGIERTALFTRGVDTAHFTPLLRSDALRKVFGVQDKKVLLYVGRISIEKELDVLLKAYEKIYKQYKDQIALIITGDGPELERYKKLFPPHTIFTGYKKGEELSLIYASSDLFVFPSSTETFGNVVLEAMASGLAVIAPNKGGVKDMISHEKNGLFFEAGDAADFGDKIARVLEDEHLYQSMRQQARITALTRGWDKVLGQLINIYKRASTAALNTYKKIG
ncbi:MAG: glycosyltransferase [Clostridia bacterium]|nr:glycosyltransferase [Clostridia bacterium]